MPHPHSPSGLKTGRRAVAREAHGNMKADRTCCPCLFIVSYIEGREAERTSRPGPGQVRAGDQSQDREGAGGWVQQSAVPRCAILSCEARRHWAVRRREFITLIGGAATWPLAARAQQPDRVRRIGVLMAFAESDHEAQSWVAAFQEELTKLGWTEGRNIEIDTRWPTADVESMQRFAKELVALQPDLIL